MVIVCNRCKGNLDKDSLKCLSCHQFRLCFACHTITKTLSETNEHSAHHPMQWITTDKNQGVYCNSCHTKSFNRKRFRCMVCRDFDYCFRCYSRNANVPHDHSHPMEYLKLATNDSFTCNHCHNVLTVNRLRCLTCFDFDLCYRCYYENKSTGNTNKHNESHPMDFINSYATDTWCDACSKPVKAHYKCMICRDYDLCRSCHAVIRKTHTAEHEMNLFNPQSMDKRRYCNVCNDRSMTDKVYNCSVCYDYDLCHKCYCQSKTLPKTNSHSENHAMKFVDFQTNNGAHCDMCKGDAGPGNRYKCLVCRDYDLCKRCRKHSAPDHNSDHAMENIPVVNNRIKCSDCRININPNQYHCLQCYKYNLCQACFERDRPDENCHNSEHPMKLLTYWSTDGWCDVCSTHNFDRQRYKCMVCRDYDLCATCHKVMASQNHTPNHSMQFITEQELKIDENQNLATSPFAESTLADNKCQRSGCQFYSSEEFGGCCSQCFTTESQCVVNEMHTEVSNLNINVKQPKTPVVLQTAAVQRNADPPEPVAAPLRSAQEIEDEAKKCKVCFENNFNTVVLPCGHLWLCGECADAVMKTTKECPACRHKIETVHRVFMGN